MIHFSRVEIWGSSLGSAGNSEWVVAWWSRIAAMDWVVASVDDSKLTTQQHKTT